MMCGDAVAVAAEAGVVDSGVGVHQGAWHQPHHQLLHPHHQTSAHLSQKEEEVWAGWGRLCHCCHSPQLP